MASRLSEVADILECQYGLLAQLLARGVLTDRQCADIQESSNAFKQNDKLILLMTELLRDILRCGEFLTSLRETGQSHIAEHVIQGESHFLFLSKAILLYR